MDAANEVQRWAACPYHEVFKQWLRSEADRPMKLDAHGPMIEAASRANTFREVRDHIVRLERQAARLMEGPDA